jgi:hypothetical protein
VTPAVLDEAEPIPLHSTDPRYSRYLGRVRNMIKAKWFYPCVKNEATGHCDYKATKLSIEFGLFQDGRVAYVSVLTKAEWPITTSPPSTPSVLPLRPKRAA